MHSNSNRDTHLFPPDNSSVHLMTITEARRSGRITNEMWKGWRAPWDFVISSPIHPSGMSLPKTAWDWLNRLHASVRRFRSDLHISGMATPVACECDAEDQTVVSVFFQSSIHQPLNELHGMMVLDDKTIGCLTPAPRSSSAKQWTERSGSSNDDEAACIL